MLENTASLVGRPFQYIGSNSIIHYLGFIVVNGFIFQYYFAEKLKSGFRSIYFLPPQTRKCFPQRKIVLEKLANLGKMYINEL